MNITYDISSTCAHEKVLDKEKSSEKSIAGIAHIPPCTDVEKPEISLALQVVQAYIFNSLVVIYVYIDWTMVKEME